ncbi:hypothetical protein [Chryseobacterium sp.]|uniref:hypothetical protein n=1 Tax=Chryseobacterium sp. TaxID=1871047 RepID=UPI00388DE3F1
MKKYIISLAFATMFYTQSNACAWGDPDSDYFNLFTQSIIKDKSYLPFLHTYTSRFYQDYKTSHIADENIEAWQKYFNNQLNYAETSALVNTISMAELNLLKSGAPNNPLLKKLGNGFYQKYFEGIDYLIQAKYLEPYMRINFVESADTFYYRENEVSKNATQLDYNKTISALTSLYNAAKNPEIKQRYGYQLVRFNHYTRNYEASISAFKNYVQPISNRGAVYYLALDQLGGAQRGLNLGTEANWNFFQVFKNSKSRKESAFVSMTLSDSASFNNILKRANTNEEKNMAYFLLGYEDFTNPIPTMEKMFDIDPQSEILKVLAARSINEIERSYLPSYYYKDDNEVSKNASSPSDNKVSTEVATPVKIGFWERIVLFFKKLFSSKSNHSSNEQKNEVSDEEILNNPNRIPFYNNNKSYFYTEDNKQKDYLNELEEFTEKTKEKSSDEFWQIADAYLKFLKKEYKESAEVLDNIKTNNPEYLEEITRMKALNDIVSQPKITAEYEDALMNKYAEYFLEEKMPTDSTKTDYEIYYGPKPSTASFLKDVLANRYFLQGEEGKSYLMSNKLSDLQYNPNSSLVKKIEEFYKKPNKTKFEQQIIAKNMDNVGNIEAFFNLIYGDRAMRLADFDQAKSYYQKAINFSGLPRDDYEKYNEKTKTYDKVVYTGQNYDGYHNISNLVFGYNVWESFESNEQVSMKAGDYSAFPFIRPLMNKLELADAILQLKKIGNGKDDMAANANQLIGNLLYNTSILGFYRHIFVMDIDNSNGGKYYFNTSATQSPFKYYYKNFTSNSFIEPDNFDKSMGYYQKAFNLATNKEQKARILFQMASAEQGKYYQYEANNEFKVDYSDPDYTKKSDEFGKQMAQTKNQKYRTYFALLKSQYSDTETSRNLMGSCTYYGYFMR